MREIRRAARPVVSGTPAMKAIEPTRVAMIGSARSWALRCR
jgi:hypothetical protein